MFNQTIKNYAGCFALMISLFIFDAKQKYSNNEK